MEILKKIITILGNVLAFIGQVPAFLLPQSLKGYRTELFTLIGLGIAALESFDITGIADAICGIFSCNPSVIHSIYALILAAGNVALRRKTNTAAHKSA